MIFCKFLGQATPSLCRDPQQWPIVSVRKWKMSYRSLLPAKSIKLQTAHFWCSCPMASRKASVGSTTRRMSRIFFLMMSSSRLSTTETARTWGINPRSSSTRPAEAVSMIWETHVRPCTDVLYGWCLVLSSVREQISVLFTCRVPDPGCFHGHHC